MNEAATLLPCPNPWCEAGEREGDFRPQVQYSNFAMVYVACTSCSMAGPTRQHEAEAIAAWNTRALIPTPDATGIAEAVDHVGANTLPTEYVRWMSSIEVDVRVHDLTADEVARLVDAIAQGQRADDVEELLDQYDALTAEAYRLAGHATNHGHGTVAPLAIRKAHHEKVMAARHALLAGAAK